ncbi:hypothetical protein K443DRAFT_678686 [Laccaria amethystina LaAM-08-1]|uniref:Uncharacterized protein n=1 Tax=Laccaria amethystina LaAM-08-1 TaxID=1095629 RepID=A0A0C9XTR7_9AGAR|nr:hypothetical protein K443DRAFT_678686 [Laccaria amethystina LaAM-08-1]
MSMQIFGEQVQQEKAEDARLSSFVGALALEDLVKSTLGPKGIKKILQSASSGEINVTNDGAAILKAFQLGDAAAKILVNISKVQDDGWLREVEKLIAKKIHQQTIVESYRIASLAALKALEKAALTDSYLDEGFLDKTIAVNSPKRMENVKILTANTSMDTDKIKIFGGRVKVDSTGKLAELEGAERGKMRAKLDAIAAHGINCFVNRQLIYNYPESLITEKGIMLGQCELIEEIMIGEDRLIKFSGVAAGEACTVVLRGPTNQMVDEAGRSLHDALSVLSPAVKETRIVLSGGCAEMLMSCAVENEARSVKGKKGLAVEAFGQALKQIPMILANNAGYDTSGVVSRLRSSSQRDEAAEMIIRVDDIL